MALRMTQPAAAAARTDARPLALAALVLGLGLGGFIDGIVLHQILGWHHLICAEWTCRPRSIADLQRKNVTDGYFHLGTLLLTLAGCVTLFRAGGRPGALWSDRVFAGGLLAGWGLFNLVEGVIDHHLLQIHHVRPLSANPLAWDLGFLASGALLLLVGGALMRAGSRTAAPAGSTPA